MKTRHAILGVTLAVAAITGGSESRAAKARPTAQPVAEPQRSPIPDTFTNLQVLPKDIRKDELMRIMKGFSITMDRRCSFCHVATDDLSQADFPSDKKDAKKKARDLLKFIVETQKKAGS